MTTATQELQTLSDALETIRNTDPQSLANMEVGDEWRQGDLRVIRLDDDWVEHNADAVDDWHCEDTQLVPGVTQGSRHCLDSLEGVTFYRLKRSTPLDGPVVRTAEPRTITHPEHGDCTELPPGTYAFPGQRAFADELRRVID